ncbi:MAG TPA: hypothetical protein H9892_05960 [Candidatus Protoclostridium stercorigallinarum]|uniref:Uncharacterized protein n=1 Tax=Candidatus Protoclostridium stercorigallinarum TaxID=2838741 RepID=A0A9D1Q103_9FIRM|nr:hypothetical protein [Candidatus Protoclostridium stercorigallinarum]
MGALIGVVIALGVICIGLIIALAVVSIKLREATRRTSSADDIRIVDGVRYTKYGTEEKADGSPVVSHLENDIVLERGRTYTVGKDKKIIPGKYAVLSASEKQAAFNLRIDGLVREVRHGDDIVLGEGDTICAVSHPVILR